MVSTLSYHISHISALTYNRINKHQFLKSQDLAKWASKLREKIGGAVGQLMDGNQTGNQPGGVLGKLGEQAKSMLPGQ